MVESYSPCWTHLTGGWVQRIEAFIELPVVPVQVTEQFFIAGTCPVYRRRRLPPAELDGLKLGRKRLDISLTKSVATLRGERRLPSRRRQWYPRTVH